MKQRSTPIQKKLMRVMMITCGSVLLLTCAAFIIYEFITYREITKRELTTLGEIIAANSTAALAFDNKDDADELLNGLQAQKHIVAACFYDKNGNIFTVYPKTLSPKDFPSIGAQGYIFKNNFLIGYQGVVQGTQRLGTLYLKSDMNAIYNRFTLYGIIAVSFIILSFIFAYMLSKRLQRSISVPILQLAQKARIVSDKKDYSIRAEKKSDDEIGALTDAFNHMLTQIETQNAEINNLNSNLEEKVTIRTNELQTANTTLREQNEFIEAIIDSSVDLIAVFNRNLEYEIVNKQSDDIYQIKKEDLIGRKLLEVFPKLKDSSMVENLRKAFTGAFVQQDVYKSLVSDRFFENFFIPLKDKDGNIDRVLVVGHDITTNIQANEKLKVLNMDLEKSNRDLEQFAYVASHDLQEPLRKIQTFAELSEKNIAYPVILKRYLQKINSSAHRMSELIKAVLNYSRLSQGENEFVEVDLNRIVGNIRTDLELLIEEKKAVIDAEHLPTINAIPLQVGQLFLNLISNSLKFCKNPPRINITSRLITNREIKKEAGLKKETNYLQLTFSDNGIGFDQQYADRVFSIFQRLHSNSEYAGTGIGLALCKKIVENHNGLITVESELNKGTNFHIYLPLTDQRKNISNENGKIVQQLNRLVKD